MKNTSVRRRGSIGRLVKSGGSGMILLDLKRYWMEIATTHKRKTVSPVFGRPRTGSKGIGRFSCRRLGTRLKLSTTAELADGRFERTDLEFPWQDFAAGKDIGEISCEGVRSKLETGETTHLISEEMKRKGETFDTNKKQYIDDTIRNNGSSVGGIHLDRNQTDDCTNKLYKS